MAEVLGPLGLCLAGMSFILGTAPAAAKFTHSYKEQRQQVVGIDNRLCLCQSKYSTWEIHWNSSRFHNDRALIRSSVRDIERLSTKIDQEIIKYTNSHDESTAWFKMKYSLRQGTFRKPRLNSRTSSDFCRTIRYALWKKEILEAWMIRLEKAIDVTEKLFEREFHHRTAQHFDGGPSIKQVAELQRLEDSSEALMSVATRIYAECTKEPETCAWALAMPTPARGKTILDWGIITPVTIQMRFSIQQQDYVEHFCLHFCFQKDAPETHITSSAIAGLIQSQVLGTEHEDAPTDNVDCHRQDGQIKTTLSFGELLMKKPDLFKDPSWLIDRAELIYGICEWSLRLWNTPWFEQLCCSGIVMEVGLPYVDCSSQIFQIDRHDQCHVSEHDSRLRNLGLVWAQLFLGYPIRFAGGTNLSKFERYINGVWIVMYQSELNDKILQTGSLDFRAAIDFCLRPESLSWSEPFQHGHLYEYMEQIFKPIERWYQVESKQRKQHPRDPRTKHPWPKAAMGELQGSLA